MTQFHGSNGIVKITAATVAEVKSFSVEESAETFESNGATMNTPAPAKTFISGPTSWNGSVECFWDDTDATGQEALTVGAVVTVHFMPEGDTTGDNDINGSAIVTGISKQASVDGIVEASFTLQGSGALTHGTAA